MTDVNDNIVINDFLVFSWSLSESSSNERLMGIVIGIGISGGCIIICVIIILLRNRWVLMCTPVFADAFILILTCLCISYSSGDLCNMPKLFAHFRVISVKKPEALL